MKYVYAALLLHSSDQTIDEKNMKKVLNATGSETDEARIKAVVASLKDVNIDEALKTSVATTPSTPTTTEAPPSKKEEKPKKVRIIAYVMPDVRTAFKIKAIGEGKTMDESLGLLIEDYVR